MRTAYSFLQEAPTLAREANEACEVNSAGDFVLTLNNCNYGKIFRNYLWLNFNDL